jgi:hypothetical protein
MTELTAHQEAIEVAHNVYKDWAGIRPRHMDFDAMTVEEIHAWIDTIPEPDLGEWEAAIEWMDAEEARWAAEAQEVEYKQGQRAAGYVVPPYLHPEAEEGLVDYLTQG